jgi:hypothetical protein
MIYTLGCSFTKWFWPTWADWLQEYQGPVTNLAWPGTSNKTIYWELLNRSDSITPQDQVYIMLPGNNRVSMWYDKEWIDQKDVQGFFPRQDGKLEFSVTKWQGLYRLHPDYDVSLTEMIVENFNLIFQIQNLLEKIGCDYRLVFWQNPWFDIRPVVKPAWQATWKLKQILSSVELNNAHAILEIPAVRKMLGLINWDKFYLRPMDIFDPYDYSGIWEYKNKKKQDPDHMKYVHTDPHPDSLLQHDFLTEIMLGTVDHNIRDRAKKCALDSLIHHVQISRSSLIPDDFSDPWPKISSV